MDEGALRKNLSLNRLSAAQNMMVRAKPCQKLTEDPIGNGTLRRQRHATLRTHDGHYCYDVIMSKKVQFVINLKDNV